MVQKLAFLENIFFAAGKRQTCTLRFVDLVVLGLGLTLLTYCLDLATTFIFYREGQILINVSLRANQLPTNNQPAIDHSTIVNPTNQPNIQQASKPGSEKRPHAAHMCAATFLFWQPLLAGLKAKSATLIF